MCVYPVFVFSLMMSWAVFDGIMLFPYSYLVGVCDSFALPMICPSLSYVVRMSFSVDGDDGVYDDGEHGYGGVDDGDRDVDDVDDGDCDGDDDGGDACAMMMLVELMMTTVMVEMRMMVLATMMVMGRDDGDGDGGDE